MPDIYLGEDDFKQMKQYIEDYKVPLIKIRCSLRQRIRYICPFRSPRIYRLYSMTYLLAFIVLLQSSDAHEGLVSSFANEPEYTNELIRIVRSEESVSNTCNACLGSSINRIFLQHRDVYDTELKFHEGIYYSTSDVFVEILKDSHEISFTVNKSILLAPKVLDQFYIEEVEVVRAEGIKMHPNCGSVGPKSVSISLIAVSCGLWIQVSIIILFKFSLHCVSA
ncbi:hypothetical protein ACLB2K_022613 [Fragaria x ananassa]